MNRRATRRRNGRGRDDAHDAHATFEITPDGRVRGLWTDAIALPPLGRCLVQRVSYVEFSTQRQCWYVREAQPTSWLRRLLQALFGRPLGRTLHAAPSREQALRWEKQHFAPGGPGWKRMKNRQHP
jgi:hypothetical protein